MSGKYALIIGNTEYNDSTLPQLTAPAKDVEDLVRVLKDPEICAFDEVRAITNQPQFAVSEVIDEFFDQKKPEDLLLLYFSGHGIRDELGALYLAFQNTNRLRLRSTAIKSDFIRDAMDQCRSRRQILILDCCNSGAFSQGRKGVTGETLGTSTAFNSGYGRIILTASDSIQYAWEGNKLIGSTENSLFTHFLVKGLQGEADKNGDGEITVDELFDYASENVRLITPKQTPSKFSSGEQGKLILRALTEAQKEARRLRELQEQQRREQEEAERLAQLNAEREAALKLAEELRVSRENAEAAAREASERVIQERARLEAIEHELAQHQAASETLSTSASIAVPRARNQYSIAIGGFIIVALLALGSYTWLQGKNPLSIVGLTQPISSLTPGAAPQLTESNSSVVSQLFTPQPFSPKSIVTPIALEGTAIQIPSQAISPQNAKKVTQFARWGRGGINDVSYSPDGNTIALASSIGIYLLDAGTLQERLFIDTQRYMVRVRFAPDGQMIIALSNRGDILKYQADDGSFIEGSTQNIGNVYRGDISPDGSLVALAGSSSRAKMYLLSTLNGSVIETVGSEDIPDRSIDVIRFSPDGKVLAGMSRTAVYLWTPESLKLIRKFEITDYYRSDFVFSPDGMQIAYVDGPAIKIISTQDGSLLQTLEGHGTNPIRLAYSRNGQLLYYSVSGGAIRVRQIDTGSLAKNLQSDNQYMLNIVFSPDGKSFVTTSDNGSVNLWDPTKNSPQQTITGFFSDFESISFSQDGQFVAVASDPIQIRSMSDGRVVQTIDSGSWLTMATFLSGGNKLVVTSNNNGNGIELWNYENGRFVKASGSYLYPDNNVAVISPDARFFVTDTYENTIKLATVDPLSLNQNGQLPALTGHTGEITALAFSPDNSLLASASADNSVRLWNTSDGSSAKVFTDQVDAVNDVAFSSNGKILASSSDDGSIVLRSMPDGTILRMIELPSGSTPEKLAFSPDGQILAVGTAPDYSILLLDTNSGNILESLYGTTLSPAKLAFTSDGKLLVSGGYDDTIRIWGVQP